MVATISDLGRSRPIRADCSQWSAMLFRQGRFFRLVVTHNSNNRKVERIKAFHLRNWSKTELIPFPNACRRGRTVTIEFVKLDKHSRFTVEPFWFLQRTGKLQRICRRFRQRSFPESKWHLLLAGKPFSIGFSLKFLRFLRLIIIQKFVNFEHRRVCSQAVIFSWKVERSTGRRRLEGSGIVVRIIWGFIVRKLIVQTLKFLFELQYAAIWIWLRLYLRLLEAGAWGLSLTATADVTVELLVVHVCVLLCMTIVVDASFACNHFDVSEAVSDCRFVEHSDYYSSAECSELIESGD